MTYKIKILKKNKLIPGKKFSRKSVAIEFCDWCQFSAAVVECHKGEEKIVYKNRF